VYQSTPTTTASTPPATGSTQPALNEQYLRDKGTVEETTREPP